MAYKRYPAFQLFQMSLTTAVGGGLVLKGASYRGNVLLSRLEWAVVHFERWRLGDHQVAVSSLASLEHGQLGEKEPFLTVHEPGGHGPYVADWYMQVEHGRDEW